MCKSDVIKAGDWAKITGQSKKLLTPCWAFKLLGINTDNEEEAMKVANLISAMLNWLKVAPATPASLLGNKVRDHEEARPRHQWPHRHRLQ